MPKPPKLSKKALRRLRKEEAAQQSSPDLTPLSEVFPDLTLPATPTFSDAEPEVQAESPVEVEAGPVATTPQQTAENVHTAAPQILAALSDSLGWALGALWTVDREANQLRCASVWHADGIDATAFETTSRATTFPLGVGIPGRAWAEGGPIWIDDVATMGRSDRIRNTADIGLHAAFALPIVLEEGALGVIEFFSRSPRKHDAALLKLMGAVGNQLAQFMQRIQVESDVHLSEQRFHALAAGPVGLWHTGPAGETLFVNPAMCAMLGVEQQSDLAASTLAEFVELDQIEPGQSLELELTGRDGTQRHAIMSEAPLLGADGGSSGTLLSFVDVTELRTVTDRLDFLAQNDPLTELANLAMFTEHLDLALHRAVRYGSTAAVIFIDIDEFTLVNEGLGRAVGDELLRRVSERLRAVTRKADVVGRQAGDEFVVLLADMDSTEGGSPSKDAANVADAVAGHIRHALQTPFTIHGNEVYVGVSTGVAVYPTHGEDSEALLSAARAAMTEARANGRGGGVSDRHASDQLKVTTRLRHAVNHDEFVLHYQPVCDISRGLIVGVEALIRWMDPERGMIAPNQFIGLAERTGMITQISDWVVTEACRQSRAWRDVGVRVGVSVNLPPILWQPAMGTKLRAEVANAGLKPNEFMIEITESAIMTDPDRSQQILKELSTDGFRLAIDDFGTGYSSLSRLRQMPVSALKIDRSFITDLPGDQDAQTVVKTIIQLAASLGLVALAEGIETKEQLSFLTDHGCHLGQGFLLSRPVPGDEIPELYRKFERNRQA